MRLATRRQTKLARLLAAGGIATLTLGLNACGPSPELKANRAAAEAAIDKYHARGLFADRSSAETSAVQHLQSNLYCPFTRDETFVLEIITPTPVIRGVACTTTIDGVTIQYIAAKFTPLKTIDEALEERIELTRKQFPTEAWTGQAFRPDAALAKDMPPTKSQHLQVTLEGKRAYIRLATAEVNGWMLEQMAFGELSRADAIEQLAGRQWSAIIAGANLQAQGK